MRGWFARSANNAVCLHNVHRASLRRTLSSTAAAPAPRAPPRAPVVRQKEWAARDAQRHGPEGAKLPWPTALFERAHRDGILPFSALRATVALDDFAVLRYNGTVRHDKVAGVMKHHELQPVHLSVLAHILLQTQVVALYPIAKILFMCAAELHDPMATMILMEQAVRHNRPADLAKAELQIAKWNLGRMAKEGNQAAQILQARILELEGGNDRKILNLLERAVGVVGDEEEAKGPTEDELFAEESKESRGDEEQDAYLADAWRQIARVQGRLGRKELAKAALQTAALDLDDPQAYYLLAQQHLESTSATYIEYLLKAALSGIANAAYKVGVWNLQEMERVSSGSAARARNPFAPAVVDTMQWYRLIRQWFLVSLEAADCDFRLQAKMHVVRLLSKLGESSDARDLLTELADDRSSSRTRALRLRELWKDDSLSSLTVNEFETRINAG